MFSHLFVAHSDQLTSVSKAEIAEAKNRDTAVGEISLIGRLRSERGMSYCPYTFFPLSIPPLGQINAGNPVNRTISFRPPHLGTTHILQSDHTLISDLQLQPALQRERKRGESWRAERWASGH